MINVTQLSRIVGHTAVTTASGASATQNIGSSGAPARAASITPSAASAPSSVPNTRSRPADRVESSAG